MHKIYTLIILVLMVSSCKRWQHEYPEDGQRSKLTPRERLLGKTSCSRCSTTALFDICNVVLLSAVLKTA